jgi:FtsZ-binding cell division protein ZapB
MTCHPIRLVGTVVGFGLVVALVGCDYWPPALQAEIEQLRSETQTLTMEKNQLQAQVTDLSRVKQELQGQMDELSRITREKTTIITGLQNQLEAIRVKALKAMAPRGSAQKAPTRSGLKPTSKGTGKAPRSQKPASKTFGGR